MKSYLPLLDDLDDWPVPSPDGPAVYGAAERIPIDRRSRRELLGDLADLSAELMTWHTKTRDVDLLQFLSRVGLTIEQTRVYLGGRPA